VAWVVPTRPAINLLEPVQHALVSRDIPGSPARVDLLGTSRCPCCAEALDQVPQWVWIMGENWGASGVYGYYGNSNGAATNADTAVCEHAYGRCRLWRIRQRLPGGSPARFHGTGAQWFTANNSGTNGGNYGYPDGHVEFVKWNDCELYRSDTPYMPSHQV